LDRDPVLQRVLGELQQGLETRQSLFERLEILLGRPVVTYFTSFRYPVILEDADVDTVAGVLQSLDLSNGLALVISSAGGDGLAAERMIKVCRSYSGTGEYWAVVPGQAKSAATMVCFGASKILMGPTSELGPVDPQITINDSGIHRMISAFHVVSSFERLFDGARAEKGNLEPYLQQLAKYDASVIQQYKAAIALSEDISIQALASGMMKGVDNDTIRDRIKMFLTPETTKTHGRPIFQEKAQECGLSIDVMIADSEMWYLFYELYIRTNQLVSTRMAKCIEGKHVSLAVPFQQGG
jgi:hypothetical protein